MLLYIDYHILSLYLKIYISLTGSPHLPLLFGLATAEGPPSSTEVPDSLGLAPSDENNGGLGAVAEESHPEEFPYQHAWVPIDVFWRWVPREKQQKQQQTCWQKTQLTQNISYLKKAWKEPYLKLKQ